ncbi:HEPN domain-containing protein [Cupriavidus sp. 2SB]|uniref:HEPN domain-containing protein n=1 Tax=Cupriavidus sp. 2SB TaxID=2502199 RepID=UPI0010F53140|nr:HEPN domain-containing protein [Cupriavidus sp. 2SB]
MQSTSRASNTFTYAISDAEVLLSLFDSMNSKPPPDSAEVLKRAGLIMALTAWETYVEDRIREEMNVRLRVIAGSPVGQFVNRRLEEELKRFHTPSADKTRRLFHEYAGIDVTEYWDWPQYDCARVKKTLDDLISKRGDAAHRARPVVQGVPPPHLVKRDDLEKAIRFLKTLVEATDRALSGHAAM